MREVEAVVIGAGQAGLSAAHHLQRLVIDFVVLDANDGPGGAWRHRWDSLTMADVHGVADLPGVPAPDHGSAAPANVTVPAYFADYEQRFDLPVERPVRVLRVEAADADPAGPLVVTTTAGTWRTRSVVNATGTWDTPFIPHYPGIADFAGEQFHTATYPGPDHLAGRRVLVELPGRASEIADLGERLLAADARAELGPVVATHGDFYEANIFTVDGRATSVIDIESAGPGHLVDDLATLMAHLVVLPDLSAVHYAQLPGLIDRWYAAFCDVVDGPTLRARTAGLILGLMSGAGEAQASARLDRALAWAPRA